MERDEYLKYRLAAIQSANEEIGKYGRYVFVLASGAIAISVTSYETIAGSAQPRWPMVLGIAWLFFLGSLLTITLSHFFAFNAHFYDLEKIDELYEAGKVSDWQDDNSWNKWTKRSNSVSFLLFTIGAGALVLFTYVNIGSLNAMPTERETSQPRPGYEDRGSLSVRPPKPTPAPTSESGESQNPPTQSENNAG